MKDQISNFKFQTKKSVIWNFVFSIWRFVIVAVFVAIPARVFAQTSGTSSAVSMSSSVLDLGMDEVTEILQLPSGDPREIAVRLINIALEFLAIITLVLVVWSGFMFLFSGGKPENMARAGATFRNAIIGLIIILCSWAIVRFVVTSFVDVMNGQASAGFIGVYV